MISVSTLHIHVHILSLSKAIHFNPVLNQLVLGTEQLAVLKLVLPPGFTSNRVLSHTYSVSAAKFSRCFNQVITACEGSVCVHTESPVASTV